MEWIYLSQNGKENRDECIKNLKQAKSLINNSIESLKKTEGIGAEFLIEKLNTLLDDIELLRINMTRIPT